jgi:hypothetical protein
MNTNYMRQILPLAAIALVAAGCDPFPAKPGGDPRIVRVTATDQDWSGHSVTVENTGAAGTVVMDQALPLDKIFVQFNKPMDGLTLQKYPNYDVNGNKTTTASLPLADQATGVCTKPDNLTSNFPANTTYCYVPSSVTDGGQLVIAAVADADDNRAAWIDANTVYKVTGTVRDYQGKALPIDVTVSLSTTPYTTTTDTLLSPALGRTYFYGVYVDWFPKAGDTGYNVSIAKDDGTGTEPAAASAAWTTKVVATTACTQSAYPTSPPTLLGSVVCQTSYGELDPSTDYWFRVQATGATTWSVAGPQSTRGKMAVTLTNYSDPAVTPPVISNNSVQVAWGRTIGTTNPAGWGTANGDRAVVVERITDDGTATEPAATAAGWAVLNLTPIADVVNGGSLFRTGVDLTAVSGTGYWYRVRPDYVSGKILVGAASYKVAH